VTTVLIADDHPLVRQGLRAVLSSADGLQVLGEASDGTEVVRLAAELGPDVVVMDLQMPGLHGIQATREILARRPGTAVLVLTMFEDDDTVFAAVAAGASGYLLKGADGDDIVTAIRSAAAGHAVFGAALARRLSRWLTAGPATPAQPFPELTDRERLILDGVAAGLTNAQIGQRLFLSAKTVANNVSNILAKLQVSQRGEAMVRAREAGLGRPEPPR
jgi:DNA-binding NarL/FixJ family response regulator